MLRLHKFKLREDYLGSTGQHLLKIEFKGSVEELVALSDLITTGIEENNRRGELNLSLKRRSGHERVK